MPQRCRKARETMMAATTAIHAWSSVAARRAYPAARRQAALRLGGHGRAPGVARLLPAVARSGGAAFECARRPMRAANSWPTWRWSAMRLLAVTAAAAHQLRDIRQRGPGAACAYFPARLGGARGDAHRAAVGRSIGTQRRRIRDACTASSSGAIGHASCAELHALVDPRLSSRAICIERP